ncbi:hypothetical protein BJ912DRAFT_117628 [Pholiota molesta]|nr:hypothetical protein BJ912DRAFT_117628 [Pholiota molesta]
MGSCTPPAPSTTPGAQQVRRAPMGLCTTPAARRRGGRSMSACRGTHAWAVRDRSERPVPRLRRVLELEVDGMGICSFADAVVLHAPFAVIASFAVRLPPLYPPCFTLPSASALTTLPSKITLLCGPAGSTRVRLRLDSRARATARGVRRKTVFDTHQTLGGFQCTRIDGDSAEDEGAERDCHAASKRGRTER